MMDQIMTEVNRRLSQIRQAFYGFVSLAGSFVQQPDGRQQQQIQMTGLAGETLSNLPVMQHVGFASGLPQGCRVIALPLMGKTIRLVAIASDGAQTMVTVNVGEVAVWDQFGHQILLNSQGVNIKGNTFVEGDVQVTGKITATENIEAGGNVVATGLVSDAQGSMADMREVFNAHAGHYSPNNVPPSTPMG